MSRSPGAQTLDDNRPSLAVLPFAYLDRGQDGRYFSDGVTEDVITELSRFRELLVIGPSSSFACEPFADDVKRVARELGVRYVLRGSIRRGGERVRITCQLIDSEGGDQIWADRQDGEMENLLDLQTELAARLAGSIASEIEHAEQRHAERKSLTNIAAYDLALQASAMIARGIAPNDVDLLSAGIQLAEKAVALDPTCYRAHYAMAWGYCRRGVVAGIPASRVADLEAADAAALHMREMDPSSYAAHAILGHIGMRRLAHDDALTNLRRANDLNPNDVTTLRWLSWVESNFGLVEDARARAELSLRLGPRDRAIDLSYWVLGLAAYVEGDHETCIRHVKRAIALNRQFGGHRVLLAASLVECGLVGEAQAAVAELRQLAPSLLESRLAGRSYFVAAETRDRYLRSLRLAAGTSSPAEPIAVATRPALPSVLTLREREILRLVAQGLSNPQIAAHLDLSDHTVKRHVANILMKMALPTRAAAVAAGARLGLLA